MSFNPILYSSSVSFHPDPSLGAYCVAIELKKDPRWSLKNWGPACFYCCFSVQTLGFSAFGESSLIQESGGSRGSSEKGSLLALPAPSAPAWGSSELTGSVCRMAGCCFLGPVALTSAWDALTDFLFLGVGRTWTSNPFRMTLMTQAGSQGQEFLRCL